MIDVRWLCRNWLLIAGGMAALLLVGFLTKTDRAIEYLQDTC